MRSRIIAFFWAALLSGASVPVGANPRPGPPGSGPVPSPPWGERGHEISGRAAARNLPDEMPAFFRRAAHQLEYLNPEPDRWRSPRLPEMNEAFRYDHYIDLENVPPGGLEAADRFEYLALLYDAGLDVPERDGGFLPFRILELHQRLTTGFAQWRVASGPAELEWIEERIVNDAGILGHYVTDAAQPHHTTIHFNGWAERAPNPEGYTMDRTFHARFESDFVNSHVRFADLSSHVGDVPRYLPDARQAVFDFIEETHGQVERLYRLDRDIGFDPARSNPETRAFVLERLAAGVEMLRALWWTAWVDSETLFQEGG